GGVVMRAADPVEEALHPQRVAVAEGAGVTHVPADGLLAMFGEDRSQTGGDVAHRLLPADLLELAGATRAPQGIDHAIGVVLHALHRNSLRTGVPAREWVLGVGTKLGQAAVFDRRDHAAERLADAAKGDAFLDRHQRRVYRPHPGR